MRLSLHGITVTSACVFRDVLLQTFFKAELAKHFDEASMASIISSKRQLTFFLSYMARAAEFWDSNTTLKTNQFELHSGSVWFEQMIMRSMDLCNKELRGNWRSFPHQFLILLGEQIQMLSSYGVTGFHAANSTAAAFRVGRRGSILPNPDGGPLR